MKLTFFPKMNCFQTDTNATSWYISEVKQTQKENILGKIKSGTTIEIQENIFLSLENCFSTVLPFFQSQ